jgi:hypothetical protein
MEIIMAIANFSSESALNNPVREALNQFRIAGCSPLNAKGQEAVDEILPMIYSLATLLEMGHRTYGGTDAVLDGVNPELVASAFDAIAQLAALALFQSKEH